MPSISNQTLQLLSTLVIVVGALTVIVIRMRAARKPTSIKKILIPPLGMSTGFLMFVVPIMRISYLYALAAFLVGMVFSIPLITSSKMHRGEDDQVYLKRSPAFVVVLLGLLVIRILLHTYIEKYISIPQTGAVFFILAFGMLLPWRIAMFLSYRRFIRRDHGVLQKLAEN